MFLLFFSSSRETTVFLKVLYVTADDSGSICDLMEYPRKIRLVSSVRAGNLEDILFNICPYCSVFLLYVFHGYFSPLPKYSSVLVSC